MPPTTAKHHAEWLSLIEISGPFLSMPVLLNAFPQGLDDYPPEEARSLKADYEFWKENLQEPAVFTAWVRLVLESMLGYTDQVLLSGQAIPPGLKAEFPEHEETLRPDFILADPGTHKARLLVQVYPPSQGLDKAVQGSRWQASVGTRMMELLHAAEVRLGLVTNGEQWLLVDAPRGGTTGFVAWYAGLWFDEPLTLRAFRSLLGVQRFFGVAEEQTIESLLAASAEDQQEVTDQLGLQVRHAVEILIQMLDRADQEKERALLGREVTPAVLYEAALTFMMRLVFMLAAEERGLLPLDDNLYAEHYAVSTLRAQLRELADQHGEEVLERRYDAWSRLLAVFRAVYHGIRHERLTLPPYGGSLFDPDRYPFLEGRPPGSGWQETPARPLPVDNRTVLHLLESLQILQVQVPGGGAAEARRLSFRALDVEQIGHVYEGLLDHQAARAAEVVLGLRGAKRQEPEIALSELEQAAGRKEPEFLAWLNERTGRSVSALKNALAADMFQDGSRLLAACGNEAALFERVRRFAGLLRADDFGGPAVILPGSVYVTAGTTRRATGTHYTPRSLTEPVVQHTLEPLVYIGVAEGLPREAWKLRLAAEILAIKVCDMAMGSAGFLVQADRYLAERLMETWAIASEGGIQITPDGMPSQGLPGETLLPKDEDERMILARRLVADRCLYGVDKNPLAVEIAKLSLWLTTMAKGRPFSFLDHALKCGDSLVGASADDFLRWAHGYQNSAMTLFDEQLRLQLETARQKRRELEAFEVKDVRDSELKAALLQEADAAMAHIKRGCDLLTGARLLGLSAREIQELQLGLLFPYMAGELDGVVDAGKHPDAAHALNVAEKERAFHWEFEFPEVFEKDGFSAFVGNPPFIGGGKLLDLFGYGYRQVLYILFPQSIGTSDFCAYFFLKSFQLLRLKGSLGLIATNTIAQGDTRRTGLDVILNNKGIIYHAINNHPWPGQASVSVNIVIVYKGSFSPPFTLDGKSVGSISSLLNAADNIKPYKLDANSSMSFKGNNVYGQGFVLDEIIARELLDANPNNNRVIFPFLNADDLNSNADQSPSRWIIHFRNWPLKRGANGSWVNSSDQQKSKWIESNTVPNDYPNYVAADFPDCLKIAEEKVKPERDNNRRQSRREKWWRFGDYALGLDTATEGMETVLATPVVSKYVNFVLIPSSWVCSHSLVVFALNSFSFYALLQSTLHEVWARVYSSTLETRLNYSPSDCFETFPFPENLEGLEQIGETYHEHRRQIMLARQEGLTSTYNRFHNPKESAEDIVHLRELHVEMDRAVAAAYAKDEGGMMKDESWLKLDLGHGFHETAQGVRFTVSESARREVLSRLLKLNHERWEEEVKAGLHEKRAKKVGGRKKGRKVGEESGQYELF